MIRPLTRPARKRLRAPLVALALIAATASLSPGSAAATIASGKVTVWLGKERQVLPVVGLRMRQAATVRTRGTLRLSLRGGAVRLRRLTVQIAGERTAISAKLGKRRLVVFRARRRARIDAGGVELRGAPLALTGRGARTLRRKLRLESLAAGRIGTLGLSASLRAQVPSPASPAPPPGRSEPGSPQPGPSQPGDEQPAPLVDPYAAQCGLEVGSRAPGGAPGPAPAPALADPAVVGGGSIEWGFKQSFRFYVVAVSKGTIVPIGPATIPAPPLGAFSFPASAGAYALNDGEDDGDDQAVIDGDGEIVLCNAPHGFRITLSNPTVTIDGQDSRLSVDVDTNMSGAHTPTQRVDLATLALDGADPFYNEAAKTVRWTDLPTTLTAAGSEALRLCSPAAPGPCEYEEGDRLDPLTVTASTDAAAPWPFGASCTLASPATVSSWPAIPPAPAPAPALAGGEPVAAGAISWGLRNSLRATVQANGEFNLSGGATRSDLADMAGAGKFFSWPAAEGEYEPGTPGRLLLRASGAVGFCNTAHGYGTVLANPTLTIDGASSRLTMDVASRLGASWTSGRVDIASLALAGVEKTTLPGPGAGEETIAWTFPDPGDDNAPGGGDDDSDSANSAVKLTGAGASALSLINLKTAGTALNEVSVSIVREAD